MKIILDVVSIDGWCRERSEGYAMLCIPFTPGIFQHKLQCYRELTENVYMDKLKRYFIGGRRIVDHKTYNGISSTDKVIFFKEIFLWKFMDEMTLFRCQNWTATEMKLCPVARCLLNIKCWCNEMKVSFKLLIRKIV